MGLSHSGHASDGRCNYLLTQVQADQLLWEELNRLTQKLGRIVQGLDTAYAFSGIHTSAYMVLRTLLLEHMDDLNELVDDADLVTVVDPEPVPPGACIHAAPRAPPSLDERGDLAMSIDFELVQDPSDSVVVLEDVSVIPSEASVSSETVSLGEVEEEDLGGIVGDPYMPGDGDEAIGVFDEAHMVSAYRLLELMAEVPASVSYGD